MQISNEVQIGIVYGGKSNEADVSKNSAKEVFNALKNSFENVSMIELSSALPKKLLANKIDVVFPLAHGSPGEDGTLQGLLDIMEIPYVGSGVKASACAMNKLTTKDILRNYNIPLAEDFVLNRSFFSDEILNKCIAALGEKIVIKPLQSGSALGVELIDHPADLKKLLLEKFSSYDSLLIEKKYYGKEITVGILQINNKITALPVIEIITPKDSWYDYQHRYTPNYSQHIIPANVSSDTEEKLKALAIKVHETIDCRDLTRSDFIVTNDDKIIFLEVNTIPGMTSTSLYPDAAQAAGIPFKDLVKTLVMNAFKRAYNANGKLMPYKSLHSKKI